MRTIAIDDHVAWGVCVSRGGLYKTAERIDVLFGVETLGDQSHKRVQVSSRGFLS